MSDIEDRSEGCTAVVYIAYAPYGIEPFARFVASYRRFPAGVAHELVIASKGFADAEEAADFRALVADLPHRAIDVPDGGFDLGTYRHIASATNYRRYCLLNSNCELRAADWLAKLSAALDHDGVIAAGATGSYQSLATDLLRMVGMRQTWQALAIAKRRLLHLRLSRSYPPFPNPHLRTNGFLIRRADFLKLRMAKLRSKHDATRFESGWDGMTRQLQAAGGTIVLVDAAGDHLPMVAWPRSATFWQDDQRALLIADNQTRRYDGADIAERTNLSHYAWLPLKR